MAAIAKHSQRGFGATSGSFSVGSDQTCLSKVRTAEDPEEAPEEEVDDRSLYHRLQEQKEKKEAEKAEEHKLRNMVQGLKKDETDFLNFVANKQLEVG